MDDIEVLFEIDATKLLDALQYPPSFNVIFFTFPIYKSKELLQNINLMSDLFKNAYKYLKDDGCFRIALLPNQMVQWQVEESARRWGLKLSKISNVITSLYGLQLTDTVLHGIPLTLCGTVS
jgi:hypothetical protein